MSAFHDNALIGASGQAGYQIERSLRFNSADSAYLNWTPANAGNPARWTFSAWVKRSKLGTAQTLISATYQSPDYTAHFSFDSSDRLVYRNRWGTDDEHYVTTQVFRDTSAWYHIVLAVDLSQASGSNGFKLYVNNVQVTTFSTSTWTQQYQAGALNLAYAHNLGRKTENGSDYFDGYITEARWVNSNQLTPSSFGETNPATGVWQPKKYAGVDGGATSFYLKFADNSGTTSTTLGKDSSGNGNNWTPNNFSVTAGAGNDSLIDTPTPYADGGNGRANYPTWNPLTNSNVAVSNGNLQCTYASAAWQNMRSTMGMPPSGKWYAEITQDSAAAYWIVGVCNGNFPNNYYGGQDANSWAWQNGVKINNGAVVGYGSPGVSGDVFMVAVNRATNSIWVGKNGTWFSGDPAAGTTPMYSNLDASGDLFFMAAMYAGAAHIANFGQRSFSYTPPAGFLALNTQNLPEPSIKKPNQWMDATTYTGNGSALAVNNSGSMQPSLLWIKGRSSATDHQLVDAVRGAKSTLVSNTTAAETVYGADQVSFDSGGFTVGGLSTMNANSSTYVCWQWKESATPGFDIVTYTGNGTSGRTISHSLGVAPSMIIVRERGNVNGWYVYHTVLGASSCVYLDSTSGSVSVPIWNSTQPSSTVVTFSGGAEVNRNGGTYVAYLWSEVAGFSKFGSYTGNGSTDGPFVYCGFRPRWIMFKSTTLATDWIILDAARDPYNQQINGLGADISNAENASTLFATDALSNGFKLRTSWNNFNQSGQTFIFAAFAESPFKYSLAR